MQFVQLSFTLLFGLVAPGLFSAQPMSAPIVNPPRQQMQTVIPNLLVGPYLLNVTGKTFAGDVFLDVAVTVKGQPVPDGTSITLAADPTTTGDSIPAGGSPVDMTAATAAGHARFIPDIPSDGDWMITLSVAGAGGDDITPAQKVGIDPHRPADTLVYALSMIAIPIVTVTLLVVFFSLRHIELERWPADPKGRPRQSGHSSSTVG